MLKILKINLPIESVLKGMLTEVTLFIFTQRLLQGLYGLITIAMLTKFMDSSEQGWYYSLVSLSSFFTVFDLGLSVVLVQIASHYFSLNRWGEKGVVHGEGRDLFLTLLNKVSKFYFFLAFLFSFFLIPIGFFIFSHKSANASFANLSWQLPWIFLVLATSLNILLLPFFSILEGTGSIKEVYIVRIIQVSLASFLCWLVISMGGVLWAATIAPAVAFSVSLIWIVKKKPGLIFFSRTLKSIDFAWSKDIWPLQWRVGLTWLSGYLITQIYTPILFYFSGPVVAGQMGLSLTIANMLALLSQSWIASRIPIMGKAVAKRDWISFDRIFRRDFTISILVYFCGAFFLCVLHSFFIEPAYVDRILPFSSFLGLLLVVFINHINSLLATHLRSFKQEPLVWISFFGAILTVPTALIAAAYFSVEGVVLAILFVQLTLTLPISVRLWFKYNRELRVVNEY